MLVLTLFFRFLIAYVFIVSSFSKIKDRKHFAEVVNSYQILPSVLVMPFSLILPGLELLLGIAVGLGFYINISSILLIFLLCLFAIALFINLIRGRNIDCGCFGEKSPQKISWNLIARDFILIFLLLIIFIFDDHSITINNLVPIIFSFY